MTANPSNSNSHSKLEALVSSLLLSYSPISSDQLVELYCRKAKIAVTIYTNCVVKCCVDCGR